MRCPDALCMVLYGTGGAPGTTGASDREYYRRAGEQADWCLSSLLEARPHNKQECCCTFTVCKEQRIGSLSGYNLR